MEPNQPEAARDIVAITSEHVYTLVGRKWPEISRILEADEEITLTFKVQITKKGDAEPGEHADKANRLKTSLSFSERYTDTEDAELPDTEQPQLEFEQ